MKKYNFFDECNRVKRFGGVLPEDINSFAHSYMIEKLKNQKASDILRRKEQKIQYGKIVVVHPFAAHVRFEFKIQCGMCTGFEIIDEQTVDEKIADYTHINNPALDMTRPKKEGNHGKSYDE